MANARFPGPLRGFDPLAKPPRPLGLNNSSLAYEPGNTPGPIGVRNHRPIRVADAPKKDPKKPAKEPDAPRATPTVRLHFYLSVTSSYSANNFYEWLSGPVDLDHP